MRINTAREQPFEFEPGDVVVLPDGGVAAVERVVGDDVYVVEWQRRTGHGPWIFAASDLRVLGG